METRTKMSIVRYRIDKAFKDSVPVCGSNYQAEENYRLSALSTLRTLFNSRYKCVKFDDHGDGSMLLMKLEDGRAAMSSLGFVVEDNDTDVQVFNLTLGRTRIIIEYYELENTKTNDSIQQWI